MSQYAALTDIELMTLLRSGNEQVFSYIYMQHSAKLYINVLKMVKDAQAAEEIIQELFTRIWHKRTTLDIETNLSAYLYKIAQNLVHDFFRKLQRDKKMHADFVKKATTHYEHIETLINRKEEESVFQQAINQLPLQQRKVYELSRIEGLSYKEVGEAMGISVHTVKEYLVLANKKIKKYIMTHSAIIFMLFMILY